jgi:PleD family two-component response regulator
VGIAPLVPGQDAEQAMKTADAALYRAKNAGRNRSEDAA